MLQKAKETSRIIDILSQLISSNSKSDRAVKTSMVKDGSETERERQRIEKNETPLTVGSALSVHNTTRSKKLVKLLQDLNLSASYSKINLIEDCIAD